ncbi:MAG: FAD:protein FMN transferase, partial [Treponema sp.]|nr:FAD:protein FMN transferase [Treponema sp.]
MDFNSRAPSRLIIILVIFITACEPSEPFHAELALGTSCVITLYDQGKKSAYDAIFNRIREIENLMSANIPSSDISRINNNAGIAPVKVNEETFMVIKRALFFARISDGAFDPTVGPLVTLWDIGSAQPQAQPRAQPPAPARE